MKIQYRKCLVILILSLCAVCAFSGCRQENPGVSTGESTPVNNPSQVTTATPFAPPEWSELYNILPYGQYQDAYASDSELKEHPGSVYISEYLYKFLKHGTDAEQVYTIDVQELSGASKEDIYQNAILPLGVRETYMEDGKIYVTQEQLAALKWPQEYIFVLWKGYDTAAFPITKDNLENCTDTSVPVQIKLNFPTAPAQQDCETEWARIADAYGAVIKVDEENCMYAYASVSPQTLINMLDDELIGEILHQGRLWDEFTYDM